MSIDIISFDEWLAAARGPVIGDAVWRLPAYRLAMFCADIAWRDVTTLAKVPVTAPVAAQLYRALGSIGANLTEGYSRSSGRDRVRLYEYSLGSARESAVWYRLAQPLLGSSAVSHRQEHIQRLVQLLLTAIPRERRRNLGTDR